MKIVKEEWMIGNKTNVEKVRKILNKHLKITAARRF